jgi:putative ABC transport system substrate-binding protein
MAALLAVCLVFGVAASYPPAPEPSANRLLVLKSHDEPAFAAAVAGLSRRMEALYPNGSVALDVRVLSEIDDPDTELREALSASRPALVVTLGTEATLWAQAGIPDLPLLFGMVLDPRAQGISPAQARAPMTGISMQIPLREQFACLRDVLPGVKRVGAVYDVRNQALIDEAQREAKRQGLELIAVSVRSPKEVPEAFRKLAGAVDALWSFPDTTVYSRQAAQFILLFSFRNRLPLMGFSRGYVRAGALFGLYADYADVGRQLAEVAHEIITGRSPRQIPISPPRRHSMALNLRVAEALGAKIPNEAQHDAEEVFK